MTRDAAQLFWERASARLAARINFALWFERLAPLAFTLTSIAAVALYAGRRLGGPTGLIHVSWLVGLATAASIIWWRIRTLRYRSVDARVLLESTLRLDARLSAAASGITPWPVRQDLPAIVHWRTFAAPGWWLASAALWAVATWAPLIGERPSTRPPLEKPPALVQTEAILQSLAQLEVTDPVSLEQLAAEVRELSARAPEAQYTHSALEAADTLREQTITAVQNLARGYDAAAGALAPFETQAAAPHDERLKGGDEQLTAALNGLRSGRLAGNRELTSLIDAARRSLGQLSPEQIKQLRSRLDSASSQAGAIAGAAGPGARIAQPGLDQFPSWLQDQYGQGGIGRGRGDAPLTMAHAPSERKEGQTQAVSNTDFSRLQLGDLAGIELGGAPDVDPAQVSSPAAAGEVAAPALGGEAVWIDRLSPGDRAVLKEIFK